MFICLSLGRISEKNNIKLPLSSPVSPTLIEWVEGESNMRLVDLSGKEFKRENMQKGKVGWGRYMGAMVAVRKGVSLKGRPTLLHPSASGAGQPCPRDSAPENSKQHSLYKASQPESRDWGGGTKNHPFFPREGGRNHPESWKRQENQTLNRSSLYDDGT